MPDIILDSGLTDRIAVDQESLLHFIDIFRKAISIKLHGGKAVIKIANHLLPVTEKLTRMMIINLTSQEDDEISIRVTTCSGVAIINGEMVEEINSQQYREIKKEAMRNACKKNNKQ